jgi:chorismate mutase
VAPPEIRRNDNCSPHRDRENFEEHKMNATVENERMITGTEDADAADRIAGMRDRIDEIDEAMINLWRERAAISGEVGRVRIASGGTRLVLAREREIVDRFRDALGADGVQLALLILRAGRGRL